MFKSVALIGLGYALKDEKGKKAIFTICKNGGNMMIKELEKNSGINITNAIKELTKEPTESEVKENA